MQIVFYFTLFYFIFNAGSNGIDNGIPSNAAHYVKMSIEGLTGFHNVDRNTTYLELFLDSLTVGGQQVGIAVQYDFTGDGVIDRTEIFQAFPPNDLTGYEKMTRYARTTQVPPGQGLQSVTGSWYQDLVNGNVHVVAWITSQGGVSRGPVSLRTDGGVPYYESGATVSFIRIPYITTSWVNLPPGGPCGEVSQFRNATFTTQAQTTAAQTTSQFTTQRMTTAVQTTVEQTTSLQTTVEQFTTVEQMSTGSTTEDLVPQVTTDQLVTTQVIDDDDEESTTDMGNTISSSIRMGISIIVTILPFVFLIL